MKDGKLRNFRDKSMLFFGTILAYAFITVLSPVIFLFITFDWLLDNDSWEEICSRAKEFTKEVFIDEPLSKWRMRNGSGYLNSK